MANVDYTKGISFKEKTGKYGKFTIMGINLEEFAKNPINERGYINVILKRSKEGKLYAVNDTYYDRVKNSSSDTADDEPVMTFDDDEIPF